VIVTDVTEGTDGERIDGSVLSFQPGASLAKHHSHRRMTSIVEAEGGTEDDGGGGGDRRGEGGQCRRLRWGRR
jgi:hypothetical protein